MVFEFNGETTMIPAPKPKRRSRVSKKDVLLAFTKVFLWLL